MMMPEHPIPYPPNEIDNVADLLDATAEYIDQHGLNQNGHYYDPENRRCCVVGAMQVIMGDADQFDPDDEYCYDDSQWETVRHNLVDLAIVRLRSYTSAGVTSWSDTTDKTDVIATLKAAAGAE